MSRPERRFWFRLAGYLKKSIAECMAVVDSREFAEWAAWDSLYPIGYERGDIQTAIIASTIANCHGAKTKLSDYIPSYGQETKTSTPEEIESRMMLWAGMHGAKQ